MQDDAPTNGAGTRSRHFLRFSLLTLLVFITVVSLILAWLVQKERVVATALFQVLREQPSLLGEKSAESFSEANFEIVKKTQLALLKSEFVLQSAVRKPTVAGVALFPPKTDQVAWLQKHLEVEFVENGEILSIKLRGNDSQASDLVVVINAVAAAYEREVLGNDKSRQLTQRDMLERSLQSLTAEIKRKYEDYLDIAKGMGRTEGGNGQIQQQLDMKRLDRIDEELAQLERDLLKKGISGDGKESNFIEQRMAQLRKRPAELEKKIQSQDEKSVDLITRKEELDQLQRVAHELSIKLEEIDIEGSAPSRIRQVQPAVITHGN